MDIYYVMKKFRTGEIKFDKLYQRIMEDKTNVSFYAVDILSEFESKLENNQYSVLMKLVRENVKACHQCFQKCNLNNDEKKSIIDVLLNNNGYFELLVLIDKNLINDLIYIIENLEITDDKNCIDLIFSILYKYRKIKDTKIKTKIFIALLNRFDIIVNIFNNYEKANSICEFSDKEIDYIYKKYNEKLFKYASRSFKSYFIFCQILHHYLKDEHKEKLINKTISNNKYEEAIMILKQQKYIIMFDLNKALIDKLEAFILIYQLSI